MSFITVGSTILDEYKTEGDTSDTFDGFSNNTDTVPGTTKIYTSGESWFAAIAGGIVACYLAYFAGGIFASSVRPLDWDRNLQKRYSMLNSYHQLYPTALLLCAMAFLGAAWYVYDDYKAEISKLTTLQRNVILIGLLGFSSGLLGFSNTIGDWLASY